MVKDAPQFLLSNPVALQKKYFKIKDNPNLKKTKTELRKAVKVGEQNALEMLVDLFDWLDNLDPQPTAGIVQKVKAMKMETPAGMSPASPKTAKNPPVSFHFACTWCLNIIYLNALFNVQRSTRPQARSRSRCPTIITFALYPTAIQLALDNSLLSMC